MTTSQENTFLSDVLSGGEIPVGKMAYFRGRVANRIHAIVLEEFAKLENEGKINRADLARRIAREPAQITRWLGSAGNWTFDTLSDLLLGMGFEPPISVRNLQDVVKSKPATEIALPNAPIQSLDPGIQAANDEKLGKPIEPFGYTAKPGTSPQKKISASA